MRRHAIAGDHRNDFHQTCLAPSQYAKNRPSPFFAANFTLGRMTAAYSMKLDKSSTILISGAGVAGLTVAMWLAKAGFRPTIVEKAPNIRADGFIVTLSHHSYLLAEEAGILDKLKAVDNSIQRSTYHDRSGRVILKLNRERMFEKVNAVQVMRDDLQNILHDEIRDKAEFIFSNGVAKIDQDGSKVDVTFDDATERSFDLVIGADGLHSAVRRHAFPQSQITIHQLPLIAAAFRSPNLLDLKHEYRAYLEPKRHSIIYSTRTDEIACIFIWKADDQPIPDPGQSRLDKLIQAYDGTRAETMELITRNDASSRIYMDRLMQIEMKHWSIGRVVLLGDATHSLTLLSGQGATSAFTGASIFGRALTRQPLGEAVDTYEAALTKVTRDLQISTRRNAKWYVPNSLAFHIFRDLSMRLLPNEVWLRYFMSKYSKA
jgi:2-polyprenyl-6-methoxyphenol hydroxylase-like FAD-dependent oxidoreductase